MFPEGFHFCKITNSNLRIFRAIKRCKGDSLWRQNLWYRTTFQRDKTTKDGYSNHQEIVNHIKKLRKFIKETSDKNPMTNTKLQSIIGASKKANVPPEVIQNALACVDGNGSNNVHTFIFHSIINQGMGVLEFKTEKKMRVRDLSASIIKRFGYKIYDTPGESCIQYGAVISSSLNNCENDFDQVLEDAILCNFEEVVKLDNGKYKFECQNTSLVICAGKLLDLGYPVECVKNEYKFTNIITGSPKLEEEHKKMEQKLRTVEGFIRIVYNIK